MRLACQVGEVGKGGGDEGSVRMRVFEWKTVMMGWREDERWAESQLRSKEDTHGEGYIESVLSQLDAGYISID